MKLIIAGSRTIHPSINFIDGIISHFGLHNINEVVSGGADGVDIAGEYWAEHSKLCLDKTCIKQFLPHWDLYGCRAGHVRNSKMAVYADALILIWDGKSNGSRNMKEKMLELNKPIYEIIIRSQNAKG